MGYYVLAVGGTGNKILESMVYCAAVDGFYTLDEKGGRVPLPGIRMLSVDVDTACGNTTRAKRAAEYYEALRTAFLAYPAQHPGFHTALEAERWNMDLSRRAMSVDRMVENHRRDQLLSRTLFSKTESALEYSEGFRGHPDLGVLFFSDLLESLDQRRAENQPDEMNDLTDQIRRELDRGERVKLVLCGSIFGGTGASGIPAIARYLRERFRKDDALFELGALLMLPYYKVPPSSRNEELEIVVKSSTFLDKARTALQYYGMEGLIRNGEDDPRGTFDALYLLGLPPEGFITTRMYSTGSQSQENDAHMMEWLATRCAAAFFRTGFRGTEAHHIDCYYYQCHSTRFDWQAFDQEERLYRKGYGGLLKAAAMFFAECYPSLSRAVRGDRRYAAKVGYCAPYFRGAERKPGGERARLEALLESLYHFLDFYSNWMVQLTRTLPPILRERRDSEKLLALARENYARLTRRRALLRQRTEEQDDTPARQDETKALWDEYDEMEATRQFLLRQIGGTGWLEVLKSAQDEARERLHRQEEDAAAQRERIDLWYGADSELIDPQSLRQEEERLAAMEKVRDTMELTLRQIGEDIESAIRENVADIPAEAPDQSTNALPDNALLDAGLMDELYALLTQYGLSADQRDEAVVQRARQSLQKGLNRLVCQRVPDKMDVGKVVAGLGGGALKGKGAEGALCSFFSTLLSAVGEEEGQ